MIWPWRWTWWYVLGSAIKVGVLAAALYYGVPLLAEIPADMGWVFWVIMVIVVPNVFGWLVMPLHEYLRDMVKPGPTISEIRQAAGYDD